MRDFELYQAILGLREPWGVTAVELDVTKQQVIVTVDAGPSTGVPRFGTMFMPVTPRPAPLRQ